MGRSQVKYNQTHGRRGAKGRGGGRTGRGGSASKATSSRRAAPSQPSNHDDTNAWRYENSAISHTGGMDLEMLDLETQKLTQYPAEKVEQIDEGRVLFSGVNLSAMGKALDSLSVADRLRIPAYLTVDLEVKRETSPQVSSKTDVDKSASRSADDVPDKIHEATTITKEGNEESHGSGDEDEDLDSWLDSVIT